MSPRSLFAIAPLETSRVSDAAYTETVRLEEVLDSKNSSREFYWGRKGRTTCREETMATGAKLLIVTQSLFAVTPHRT